VAGRSTRARPAPALAQAVGDDGGMAARETFEDFPVARSGSLLRTAASTSGLSDSFEIAVDDCDAVFLSVDADAWGRGWRLGRG